MTEKFEKFMTALEALCERHGVELSMCGERMAVDEQPSEPGQKYLTREEFKDCCGPF